MHPNSSPPIAILASGGMDSFLVWAHFHARGQETLNIFVDVGQKYRRKERWAWSHLCHTVPGFKGDSIMALNLSHLETPSGIIPNRNAHLILAAATISPIIALGILHGEINSDKSEEFLAAMTHVLNISNRSQYWNEGKASRHELLTPLKHMTKTEAVAEYLRSGMPLDWLFSTISCYDSADGHCGACPSCFKRWVALANNGLHVEDAFKADPRIWAHAQGIIKKAQDGTYAPRRAAEIHRAIEIMGEYPATSLEPSE